MASQTTNIGLTKQADDEVFDGRILNGNLDILDTEVGKRGKTVNGIAPDGDGNYQVNEVPFARQIVTDDTQQSSDEYLIRTTGGSASIGDGGAKVISIYGRSLHTGVVTESIDMTVNNVAREPGEDEIAATLDRDTFVAYVDESGTIELEYTDAWSANPSLYGITVSGTPLDGDSIVIVYEKADRGTITNSNPGKFISTGWNLYNHTLGYARVIKYSDTYGFMIGGTYTAVQFSATLDGTKTAITPASGKFTIPSDGYVWVTGGNSTSTYIIMTWSDWTGGYSGTFQAYVESVINLSTIMSNFPYGLMQVGGTSDEIDLSTGNAISRIERMTYSAENIAIAEASGRAYDADEDYIYIVRASAVTYSTSISGDFAANDHGLEIITDSTVPVFVQTLYGQNLVDKLRTDVVTKSGDLVNNANQTAAGKALDARQGKVLNDVINGVIAMIYSGTVNNGTDLNTVITPGNYFLNGNYTYINMPGDAYTLCVMRGGPAFITVFQIAYGFNSFFFRYRTSESSWSAWRETFGGGSGWLDAGTNIDNITAPGTYGLKASTSYSGTVPPESTNGGILEVMVPTTSFTYGIQRFFSQLNSTYYVRYRNQSSGTAWGRWYKYKANEGFDPEKMSASANTAKELTVANNTRAIIYIIAAAIKAEYIINCTSAGDVSYSLVGGSDTEITVSTATNKLTFTTTANVDILVITIGGSVTW